MIPASRVAPATAAFRSPPRSLLLLLALTLGCGGGAAATPDGELRGSAQSERSGDVDALAAALDRNADAAVQQARGALAEGRPFLATQLLAPALREPARRTPEVVMLAGSAAAAWEGWSTVRSLLAAETWLDTHFDGMGRELLARAALALNDDTIAGGNAELAAAQSRTDDQRGVRLALLARSLERRQLADSAAATYASAGRLLPASADWLRLRAAAITRDAAGRQRYLRDIQQPLVRERVPLTEAQALERASDLPAAVRAYQAAGAPVSALRVRAMAAGGDTAERAAVRAELLGIVTGRRGTADARTAIQVLEEQLAPLSAAEALQAARSLAQSGPAGDAARLFAAADRGAGATLTGDDRLAYGRVLFRLARYEPAAAQLARVPATHRQGGTAAYEHARALLRAGEGGPARSALRAIPQRFPRDTAAVGQALYLLSDLATDEGRDDAARRTYRELAATYPTSGMAPRARFNAAIIAYAQGAFRAAVAEFDTLAQRHPQSADAQAAMYWAGRAALRLGDTAGAHDRWRRLIAREPLSYYAVVATGRLQAAPWTPALDEQPRQRFPRLDDALARLDELERLGFTPEARRELDALVAAADASPALMLATAEALHARGQSSRGIALGTRALSRGAPADLRTYRTIYPVVHREVLAAESRERGLDPALVAALIRQESNFLATALSPVGARGLMQLMPAVGRSVARGMNFPVWDEALLYQPDVSIRLGTAHMAALDRQYTEQAHVLAAYNAGGSRVARWRQKAGAGDPELFTERIPFVETRDYVRIVERNRAIYQVLYTW